MLGFNLFVSHATTSATHNSSLAIKVPPQLSLSGIAEGYQHNNDSSCYI